MQDILGHRHIDTTLGYASLCGTTETGHYYRAMGEVEESLQQEENTDGLVTIRSQSPAMLNDLHCSTLKIDA